MKKIRDMKRSKVIELLSRLHISFNEQTKMINVFELEDTEEKNVLAPRLLVTKEDLDPYTEAIASAIDMLKCNDNVFKEKRAVDDMDLSSLSELQNMFLKDGNK